MAFLSQVFQANLLVIDASGRVQHWRGKDRDFPRDTIVTGEDIRQVLAGRTIQREGPHPSFEGVRFLWVGVPIWREGEVIGAILVYAPLAPLEARIRGLGLTFFLALLSGALLAGALSFFLSRHFTKRLVAMERAAEAMARGDYSARVEVEGQDEVASLAFSLNQLAGELEKRWQNCRGRMRYAGILWQPYPMNSAHPSALSRGTAKPF